MMRYQKGIKLALITAMFSGWAVFVNKLVVGAVGDALVFTTLKNLGVALVIGGMLLRKRIEWKQIRREDWGRLMAIGVIGGSLPFYLFFQGLMWASSAQAGLIHKSLVLWVAIGAGGVLKERLSLKQWGALGLVVLSNFLVGGFSGWQWGRGEMMILLATMLWAGENVLAKLTLKRVEAEVVVGARMILGSVLLLIATGLSGKMGLVRSLSLEQWGLTLVTVGLLTGYVLSWYRALKLTPASLVAVVLSLGSIITSILSGIFITHNLSIELFYQSLLLIGGLGFFVKEARRTDEGIVALR